MASTTSRSSRQEDEGDDERRHQNGDEGEVHARRLAHEFGQFLAVSPTERPSPAHRVILEVLSPTAACARLDPNSLLHVTGIRHIAKRVAFLP